MSDSRLCISGVGGMLGAEVARVASEEGSGFDHVVGVDLKGPFEGPKIAPVSELETLLDTSSVLLITHKKTDSVVAHAAMAGIKNIPVVVATTGLTAVNHSLLEDVAVDVPVVLSSNFSLDVTWLVRDVEQKAARLGPGYDVEIWDIHHRNKTDAPSGTARKLAEAACRGLGLDPDTDIIVGRPEGKSEESRDGKVFILSSRGGTVFGRHEVWFLGQGQRSMLGHEAESREAFARGASFTLKWALEQEPGLYGMEDVYGIK